MAHQNTNKTKSEYSEASSDSQIRDQNLSNAEELKKDCCSRW